eukprot:936522-Prymnesium_polylepis.1
MDKSSSPSRGAGSSQAKSAGAASETTAPPTHFLLYLNEETFTDRDGALASEVRVARAAGLPVVMMHESDKDRQDNTTRLDQQRVVHTELAIAFVSGDVHRVVSQKLFAKKLGAEVVEGVSEGAVPRSSRSVALSMFRRGSSSGMIGGAARSTGAARVTTVSAC